MSNRGPWSAVQEFWQKWRQAFHTTIEDSFTPATYPRWSISFQEGELSCQLRRINQGDVWDLVAVEAAAYEGQAIWGLPGFSFDLSRANTCYYVLLANGNLVGYIGIRLDGDQAHLTQVAVHPSDQGKGFGRRLVQMAMDHAQYYQATHMVLEVREGNKGAQVLYRSMGFRTLKRLSGYYQSPNEDGLLMLCPFVERGMNFEPLQPGMIDLTPLSQELAAVLTEGFAPLPAPYTEKAIHSHLKSDGCRDYRLTYFHQTVAYMGYQVAVDQADLLYLTVLPDFRREGLADYLLTSSLKDLARLGVQAVFLEVRPSNVAAKTLYESSGFQEIYRRKDYYTDPKEDAVVMQKLLSRKEEGE